MNDFDREQILHKILAASAFVFALAILPVAQYYLVTNQQPTTVASEQGTVAGASTDSSIVRENVPALDQAATQACLAKKDKDSQDLQSFLNGKMAALWRSYNQAVDPYKQAITQLSGEPTYVTNETIALNKLIDAEYQTYLQKLSEVQKAVDAQKQQVEATNCP